MPALVLFRRKWLIASDDFFFPSLVEVLFRSILLCATCYMLWVNVTKNGDCSYFYHVLFFLIFALVDLSITGITCGFITWLSGQGSTMQVDERRLMSSMLYVKIGSLSLDFMVIFLGFGLYFNIKNTCVNYGIITFTEILVIITLAYFAIFFLFVFLTYNPLGSFKFWKDENKENVPHDWREKAESVWALRLKCAFCGLGNNSRNETIYKEVALFIAEFFKNIDLVPTDLLTGIMILSKKHASERKRLKFIQSLCINGYDSPKDDNQPSWMTSANALHFLRLAKSAYGWLTMTDTCNVCTLASRTRCCGLYLNDDGIGGYDDCCKCNIAAIQRSNGFQEKQLVYVSYRTKIYEPAFFVGLDNSTSSIVIAIRGTLSSADIVTDLDACTESFQLKNCETELFCHRGTLKSAQYIYQRLIELNILKLTFAEHPDYNLVITGHSLGGSIGAVLGLLLRNHYSDLKCYAFGPSSALSAIGVKLTQEFTLSVVVGDDFVPRLCTASCEKLIGEIFMSLEECRIEKYKVVLNACSKFLFKKTIFQAMRYPKNDNDVQNENAAVESRNHQTYPPGRILFLEKTIDGYKGLWKTGQHFQRIIISPKMFADHNPRKMQKFLEKVLEQTKSTEPFANSESNEEQKYPTPP